MSFLEGPLPEIAVGPLNEITGPTSIMTALCRKGAMPDEALFEARARSPEDELGVLVAPCGVGSDLDTLILSHNLAGYPGTMTMWGLDIVPDLISEARSGCYLARQALTSHEVALLRTNGFGVLEDQGSDGAPRTIINAAPLRKGHRVRFLTYDLVEDEPLPIKPNLIAAHNFFYNLTHRAAIVAIKNMAFMLAPGGVLSVGDKPPSLGLRMNKDDSRSMLYRDWLSFVANDVLPKAGVRPILEGDIGAAVMFAKD